MTSQKLSGSQSLEERLKAIHLARGTAQGSMNNPIPTVPPYIPGTMPGYTLNPPVAPGGGIARPYFPYQGMYIDPQYQYPPGIPLGMDVAVPQADEADIKIREYKREMREQGSLEVTDPRFVDLPLFTEELKAVTMDFPDDRFIEEPGLVLQRKEWDQLCNIGRAVLPMISRGFSHAGIAGMFTLAYHLIGEDETYVYDDATFRVTAEDVDLLDIEELNRIPDTSRLPPTSDEYSEGHAYAYLCASLLRLFSKSEENYVRAFPHIISGYAKLYSVSMNISPMTPNVEALRSLTHQFSHYTPYRMTLYRFLYHGGETTKSIGLRRFLFELHLANAGMHIVGLFAKVCDLISCTPGAVLTYLSSPPHTRQINAMVEILRMGMSKDAAYSRNMWRYGRIFDENFMTPLQTKKCSHIVYVLASTLKQEAPQSHQDILNIKQLEDISDSDKKLLTAVAEVLRSKLRESAHGKEKVVEESGKSSLPISSVLGCLHSKDVSAPYSNLKMSAPSAGKVQQSSSEFSGKPSFLRMPSPSLGFFLQVKAESCHAVSSQKMDKRQPISQPNEQKHICHLANASAIKPSKFGSSLNQKPVVAASKSSENICTGSSGILFDSRSNKSTFLDLHPASISSNSSYIKQSCFQVVNKNADCCLESQCVDKFSSKDKAFRFIDADKQPDASSQTLSKGSNGIGNRDLHSHVDNNHDKKYLNASLEIPELCINMGGSVSQADNVKDVTNVEENGSVATSLSHGVLAPLLVGKHVELKLKANDCPISAEVQCTVSYPSADHTNSLLDRESVSVCQTQPQEKNYDVKCSNHTDFDTEQTCASPSYSSINLKTQWIESVSSAESLLELDDHDPGVSQQDVPKLKDQLKAQPFSDEWITAAETFGEEIFKMKTGTVQNSPPGNALPEPSPWSPVKKNQDLGPHACTKYTKDKFSSYPGT